VASLNIPVQLPTLWAIVCTSSFAKLIKPMVAFLRERGMRLIIYLDNMLVMGKSKEELTN